MVLTLSYSFVMHNLNFIALTSASNTSLSFYYTWDITKHTTRELETWETSMNIITINATTCMINIFLPRLISTAVLNSMPKAIINVVVELPPSLPILTFILYIQEMVVKCGFKISLLMLTISEKGIAQWFNFFTFAYYIIFYVFMRGNVVTLNIIFR